MICCPLSESDEPASLCNATYRVARKEHKCTECVRSISVGTKHKLIKMLYDGAWESYRICTLCDEIGKHFACGQSRVIGALWTDLEENFFPDMKAGGPCMEGLSPEAESRLFEARTAWLFERDQDEYRVALPPRSLP